MTQHDPELRRIVQTEVGEGLDALLELTERLQAGTLAAGDYVRSAFRIFHNAKGALRLAGFSKIEALAHFVEDGLSELRKSGEAPSEDFVDAAEQALSACVHAVEAGGDHPEVEAALNRIVRQGQERAPSSVRPGARAPNGSARQGSEGAPVAGETSKVLRVDAARLDRLMDLGSEYLAQHSRQRRQRAVLRDFADRMTAELRRDPRLKKTLSSLTTDFEAFVRKEEQELRRSAQLTADFDNAMRGVRMQPLSVVVPQLRRVVSETARELGKAAHLVDDLSDVELDRHVLDTLREPLMHLLRNAVDHGIEAEAQRLRAGKPVRGEVRVAARLQGANVELRVSDDGAGPNLARIRSRAIELELIAADDQRSEDQLLDATLFAPGFSTAAQVSHVSGRGVGLDIVRARVSELGGQVYATSSAATGGLTFTLSVPASVVSLRGLAVTASGAVFVLPSAQIERTLRVRAEALGSAEGVTVVTTPEGEPLRLRWLSTSMGLDRTDDGKFLQVVVITEGTLRLGLVVDEVQGDTSFVIKRLPWNVRRAKGVIGATHQGDATLALVVDVAHLFRGQTAPVEAHRLRNTGERRRSRVLVADDSLTSRTLERNILVGAGYEVHVVEDGAAALEQLELRDFDLLVSDVQMPTLDGLELTRRVRAHSRLSRLPIILVTSLERPEDVAEGARAGADEYIVKGQFDQEVLLQAVSRLL